MRQVTRITILVLILLRSVAANASDVSGGTLSPFALGTGGRSIAMGRASAAVWGGSCALIWNPAGMENIERAEISLFHTPLLDKDASYYSAIGSYPFLDAGTISFGILQLGINGIEVRDEDNLISGPDLSVRQSRYLAGYSRSLYGRLTGGLTLKLDRFEEGSYSASGFGADIGFGYQRSMDTDAIDGIAFGMTLFNMLEPSMRLAEEESGDPRGVRAGIAIWGPFPGNLNDRLLLAFDLEDTRLSETGIHAGVEYGLEPYVSIRGGYDDGDPTFGLGFRFATVSLDYAFRTSDLESYHLFSLTVGFGATRTRRLEERQAAREREIREQIDMEIAHFEENFVEGSIHEAEASKSEGRFEDAAALFDKVLMMDPGNEEAKRGKSEAEFLARLVHADSLYEKGDYAGALLIFRSLSARQGSEDLTQKISSCERMISRADDRRVMVESMFERGLELYSDRQWAESAAAFRGVLGFVPQHELAAGYLQKSVGKIEDERERTMLRIDELTAAGRYGESIELIQAGAESYGNVEELESRLARVRQLQADAARMRNTVRPEPASEHREPSAEELEHIRPIYESGASCFRDGKFDKAVSEWEPVWEDYPDYENLADYLVKAYQYWGMELYTKHRYEEALEVWERILRVDSENEKALRYIRRTKEELERLESLTR
jgi:tetratricopeptide (TPR) repeat protein